MKKRMSFVRVLAVTLLSLAGFRAHAAAAAATGNCTSGAVPIYFSTSEQTATVTLQRQYSEYFGSWLDATIADTDVENQQGGYYYTATLTVGNPYVLWVTDSSAAMSVVSETPTYTVQTSGSLSMLVPSYPNTLPSTYTLGNVVYTYIDADRWSGKDSGTAIHYFLVNGGKPGTTCKLHYVQGTLASVLPSGTEGKPIALDFSADGSVAQATPNGSGTCYFSASLAAGTSYVLTVTPTASGDDAELAIVSPTDASAVETSVDGATGKRTTRISPAADGTYVLKVTSGANANLAWHLISVGTVGFSETAVPVALPADYVELTVTRQGDTAAQVTWGTVSESAVAGTDYLPASGTLTWAAGDLSTRTVRVPLLAPLDASVASSKTFSLRMVSSEYEGCLAQTTPSVARVTLTATGSETPGVDLPSAVDEESGTDLAAGTFEGVLTGGTEETATNGVFALANVRVQLPADGTKAATVTVNGTDYPFVWQQDRFVCTRTLSGKSYTGTMTLTLPEGTVGDLDFAAASPASVGLNLYVEIGGSVRELAYSGVLCRVESRLATATIARMAEVAGTYAYALFGDAQLGVPGGNGVLSAIVAADGTASVSGYLPDGTAFSTTGAADDTAEGTLVAFAWSDGVSTFGGRMNLATTDCDLVWRDDRPQFGGSGTTGFAMELSAEGGRYDPTRNFATLFRGYELAVDSADSAFDGLTLTAEAETFSTADGDVALAFDRTRGVLTGETAGSRFQAVLLPDTDGFLGTEQQGAALSLPFEILSLWTDPDYSETWPWTNTVSFVLNGGTGTTPAAQSVAAGFYAYLPTAAEISLVRENYEFVGWLRSDTLVVCAGGTLIPAPAEDLVMTAQWKYSNRELCEALDTTLEVEPGGSVMPFVDKTQTGAVGGSSVRSGAVKGGQTSTLTATFSGTGTLSFKYALTCLTVMDMFRTTTYGVLSATVDGNQILSYSSTVSAWNAYSGRIETDGNHTLVITFSNAHANNTTPAAWIDQLIWESDRPKATVTFDANGTDASVSPTENAYVIGEPIGTLPVPAWANDAKTFVGWTDAKCRTVTAETVVPSAGLALTAQWTAKTWTLTYENNEAGVTGSVPAEEVLGETEVVLPAVDALTKTGRELVAWSDGETEYPAGSIYLMPNAAVTLTAVWSDTRYRLSFVNEDPLAIGSAPSMTNGTMGAEIVLPSAPSLYKSGFVLVGWSDGTQVYGVGATFAMPATDVVLTAVWRAVCSVSFANGEEGATGTPPASTNVTDGTVLILPDGGTLARIGYVVTGWTDGSSVWQIGDAVTVTGDLTLTAVWAEKGATVTFADSIATASGALPEALSGAAGAKVTLPDAGTRVRSGYQLLGWTDGAKLWLVGADYRLGTEDVELTAVWTRAGFNKAVGGECVAYESSSWSVDGASIASGSDKTAARQMTIIVYGKGTLSFDYQVKISSNARTPPTAKIAVSTISGTSSGTMKIETSGRTEITVSYGPETAKNTTGYGIWLSKVVWTPASRSVKVSYDEQVASVLNDGVAVANGEILEVEGDSLSLTVTGTAWRSPYCTTDNASSSDAADAGVKTFTVGTEADVEVAFSAKAYAGDANCEMVIGGKTVDAAKACAWGVANKVAEADLATYYDDYLLNEAPGAGGGIEICGADFSDGENATVTIGRTKDCFSLDAINGTIVILRATDLLSGFKEVAETEVSVEAEAATATVVVPLPSSEAGFFKAQIK